MKRSTGLYFILMVFIIMLKRMMEPMLMWEFILIMIIVNVGCKALIKD